MESMVGDPNSGNQPVNFGQLVRFTVFSATQVVPANAGDIRSLGGSLMRWMKLEPIIQSEVSQKDKEHYNILTHIYGI